MRVLLASLVVSMLVGCGGPLCEMGNREVACDSIAPAPEEHKLCYPEGKSPPVPCASLPDGGSTSTNHN